MKMIALTPAGYWTRRRNKFDTFVTFIGVVWIFVHFGVQFSEHPRVNIHISFESLLD
jgi:hypothetical protein